MALRRDAQGGTTLRVDLLESFLNAHARAIADARTEMRIVTKRVMDKLPEPAVRWNNGPPTSIDPEADSFLKSKVVGCVLSSQVTINTTTTARGREVGEAPELALNMPPALLKFLPDVARWIDAGGRQIFDGIYIYACIKSGKINYAPHQIGAGTYFTLDSSFDLDVNVKYRTRGATPEYRLLLVNQIRGEHSAKTGYIDMENGPNLMARTWYGTADAKFGTRFVQLPNGRAGFHDNASTLFAQLPVSDEVRLNRLRAQDDLRDALVKYVPIIIDQTRIQAKAPLKAMNEEREKALYVLREGLDMTDPRAREIYAKVARTMIDSETCMAEAARKSLDREGDDYAASRESTRKFLEEYGQIKTLRPAPSLIPFQVEVLQSFQKLKTDPRDAQDELR